MKLPQERIEYLLLCHMEHRDMTPKELLELQEWVAESPENATVLQMLEHPERMSEVMQKLAVQSGQGASSQLKNNVFYLPLGRWVAVACVILLILSGGIYWWVNHSNGFNAALSASYHRATLALSNGRQVLLDGAAGGVNVLQSTDFEAKYVTITDSVVEYREPAVAHNSPQQYRSDALTTQKAAQFQLILPDGTHVWLNSISNLRYPTSFKDSKDREVELSGEAYFEVASNPAKPFKVKVDRVTMMALGTRFNIAAYPKEGIVQATLLEGNLNMVGDSLLPLNPRERVTYTGQGQPKVHQDADTAAIIAWKNGFFYFSENDDLRDEMRQLARWYDVEVEYEGNFPNIGYKGGLDRKLSLETIIGDLNQNDKGIFLSIRGKKIIVAHK